MEAYSRIGDEEQDKLRLSLEGVEDEPLPCCGCGVGWCSFLLGFVLPVFWFYGTFRFFFFAAHFRRDLRERPGFAACAIAALAFTVGVLILAIVLLAK